MKLLEMFQIKRKPATPAEEKIEQIKNLLFPPLALNEEMQKDGEFIKYHIDYSIDSNLDAVLMDLQDGNNDPACHKTLSSVIERLQKIRRLLEAYAELDSEAKYIIVDDGSDKKDIESAE